jgi:hypothetical protein
LPLKTTDAVEGETWAARATSAMVGLRALIDSSDARRAGRAH